MNYADGSAIATRKLPSDPMSIDIVDPNLVYTGLRSGMVSLEDLRVPPGVGNVVGFGKTGKAVAKVKRVSDGAVPWGMIVSRLGDEVSGDTSTINDTDLGSYCYMMSGTGENHFTTSRGISTTICLILYVHPCLVGHTDEMGRVSVHHQAIHIYSQQDQTIVYEHGLPGRASVYSRRKRTEWVSG
jgi:hypothetical protein